MSFFRSVLVGALCCAGMVLPVHSSQADDTPEGAWLVSEQVHRATDYVQLLQIEEAVQSLQVQVNEYLATIPAPAQRPASRTVGSTPTAGGGFNDCGQGGGGNSPLPAYITARESGDSYCAVNGSSGAFGRYQFLPSTWNSSCSDLPKTPDGQDQCAARISNGGTNLQPWAL